MMDIFGIILMALAMITIFKFPQEIKNDNGKMVFTILYVTIPFGFALGLPDFYLTIPISAGKLLCCLC